VVKNGEKKGLFLKGSRDLTIEDIQKIAKKEALRIGFDKEELIRVRLAEYKPQLDGWIVVVQSLW